MDSSDPVAIELVRAIHAGDTGSLGRLLADQLLIDADADPNGTTGGDQPESPLHWAASSDDADVAEVLIGRGADVNATTAHSRGTPLDVAAQLSTRRENLVTWLRDHGAQPAEPAS